MAGPGLGVPGDPRYGPPRPGRGDQPLPFVRTGMGGSRRRLRYRRPAVATGQDGGMTTNHAHENQDVTGKPMALRLRAARESSGLTQAQAAAELGVSRPLLIAIEKGTREVGPDELVRLAQIYGKPVSALLRPTPPPVAIGMRFRA